MPTLLRKAVARIPEALLLLGILGTLGSPLGIWSSHIERLSHFRLWWIILLTSLVILFAIRGRRLPAILAAVPALWAVWTLIPYYTHREPDTESPAIKIVAWNLLWENETKSRGAGWLSEQDADLILLTECTSEWHDALGSLPALYPYRIDSGRDGAEGMWLLSRYPVDEPDPAGLAPSEQKPWISTVVRFPDGPVRVVGLHPRVPRSGYRFDYRNAQLDLASAIAVSSEIPVIVLGDFNCTPFSPWFQRLLKRGGLRDSSLGFGIHQTWQSNGIGLPIDHILVNDRWSVVERRVYPERMGSDHHPVVAMLRIGAHP